MRPGSLDLDAYRWAPFDETIEFVAFDFTGATLAMQVRLYRDAEGDPLIGLGGAEPPEEGLSVAVATVEGVTVSTIRILIDEATIEALLPFPENGLPAGIDQPPDVELAYDIVITGGGLPKTRWLQGKFTIHAGATQ